MNKISMTKVAEVLADAAAVIRQVTQERDEAVSKLASVERRQEVEKLAAQMKEKGLSSDPTEHLIENLEKAASEGRLDKLKDAVELVAPDMWSKFASPSDDRRDLGGAGTDLERYLEGGLS